jgi:hypothetical protein
MGLICSLISNTTPIWEEEAEAMPYHAIPWLSLPGRGHNQPEPREQTEH